MPNIVLEAMQNTFVSKLYPRRNYNCFASLFTGKSPYRPSICRSLFTFDTSVLPSSVNIKSALLKLYIYRNDIPTIEKPTSVHNLLVPFNKDTVTYSNQPSYDLSSSAALNITSEKNTFLYWDITSIVNNWFRGIIPNYGLILTGVESEYSITGFLSNKFNDNSLHPSVIVDYSENNSFVQYPPIKVISSDVWSYTPPIVLHDRIGTFGIENVSHSNSAYVKLQLSPNCFNWLDDCPTYMSINEFSPGNNAILTTNGYMAYARVAYKSVNSDHSAELIIYTTTKKQ